MGLSAEDCELETSINVSANIGLFEGGVEFGVFNPDPQAAIDFLQGNAITPFQINYAAKANFEARVFEPCGGDIPCGLFEVDMGDGEFVPYCGPIEGEWTVRLAGDAAEISGSFIWNGVTLENGGPTTKEINTKIGVPEPSSALLVALSMGGLFFCRPRQG